MKILVPLNGSPKSEAVIPFVTNLALRWKAEVLTLTVVDPVGGAGDPIVPLVTERFYRENVAAGEDYIHSMSARFANVSVRPFCRVGSPEDCITGLAEEEACDLIILGSHGHSGFMRWLCGSVAEGLVRHSPCPVLLVRNFMPVQFRQILIPVDETETCRRVPALIPAPFLSPETQLTLLHCCEPALDWKMEDPRMHLESTSTPAPEGICQWLQTHDCDLICMATHGRGGLEHLWKGSITEEVARASNCPVLVFPPALFPPQEAAS